MVIAVRPPDAWAMIGWLRDRLRLRKRLGLARVSWDADAGGLVVAGRTGWSTIPVSDPGTLPELARERVTHTRLGRWRVRANGRPVIVEARREVGSGRVLWFADSRGAELDAVITQLCTVTGIDPPDHRAASVR